MSRNAEQVRDSRAICLVGFEQIQADMLSSHPWLNAPSDVFSQLQSVNSSRQIWELRDKGALKKFLMQHPKLKTPGEIYFFHTQYEKVELTVDDSLAMI